jgi:DNA mismatch repair ATPase MutS
LIEDSLVEDMETPRSVSATTNSGIMAVQADPSSGWMTWACIDLCSGKFEFDTCLPTSAAQVVATLGPRELILPDSISSILPSTTAPPTSTPSFAATSSSTSLLPPTIPAVSSETATLAWSWVAQLKAQSGDTIHFTTYAETPHTDLSSSAIHHLSSIYTTTPLKSDDDKQKWAMKHILPFLNAGTTGEKIDLVGSDGMLPVIGILLEYISKAHYNAVPLLQLPRRHRGQHMVIDAETRQSLELFNSWRVHKGRKLPLN